MVRVEIKQKVRVYEVEGKEALIGKGVTIGVDSHWNRRNFVVLAVGGKEYTVVGSDLKTAADNAMNSGEI